MPPAKGPSLASYPQVRATLNAVWEMEPQTELLKLPRERDRGPYTASTAIRVAKGHVAISYAVLIKKLFELPELSDFDARVGSKDYKKLYRVVKNFISQRRRTREQIRAMNEKAYAKKRARANYERDVEPPPPCPACMGKRQHHICKKQRIGIDMGPAGRPYRPRQR